MKKTIFVISLVSLIILSCFCNASEDKTDINTKVAQLDIDTATLDDVVRVFGEPMQYAWGNRTFTREELPVAVYCLWYPNKFHVIMKKDSVSELRFQSEALGYVWTDGIKVGSSLDEVLNVVGQPSETVVGAAQREIRPNGVLYKDINDWKGFCYYCPRDKAVSFFFTDYKVNAIYVTRSDSGKSGGNSLQTVQPIQSVNKFDNVRWKDMSKLDLSDQAGLAATLNFNQKTIWPKSEKLPPGYDPQKLLTDAMNPGLGVRKLHEQGITGKGVNVAIIDQPMYLDHPEFAGKIAAYHDTGCGAESSMHGPAVASLLVGNKCGTAPGARVYYAAAPSWKKDSAYYAKALYWIIEQNQTLPPEEKIRVVSVSAAPSGPGTLFDKHNKMWDRACKQAETAGILVLDCTSHRGFIEKCWYDLTDPENIAKCVPGQPGLNPYYRPGDILAPASIRTVAEEYDKGDYGYTYNGRGGTSWTIPYCAGVLAMGWQVNPNLSPEQMRKLLFKSALSLKNGAKIINPSEFIRLVKEVKSRSITKKDSKNQ